MILSCEICTEVVTANETVQVTICGHLFHSNCLSQWFTRGNNTCPHCRRSYVQNNLVRVYLTSANDVDVHLNTNCPANQLKDDLAIAHSSVTTLRTDLHNLSNENEELKLKLLSMEDYSKKQLNKLSDENNELELRLSLALAENEKKVKLLKESEEKMKNVENNNIGIESSDEKNSNKSQINALNIKCKDLEKKLRAANDEISNLKCIQQALINQNISQKGQQTFNQDTPFKGKQDRSKPLGNSNNNRQFNKGRYNQDKESKMPNRVSENKNEKSTKEPRQGQSKSEDGGLYEMPELFGALLNQLANDPVQKSNQKSKPKNHYRNRKFPKKEGQSSNEQAEQSVPQSNSSDLVSFDNLW